MSSVDTEHRYIFQHSVACISMGTCRIRGSHSGGYEEFCLLGCNTCSTLKASIRTCSFGTPVDFQRTTRRCIPEDRTPTADISVTNYSSIRIANRIYTPHTSIQAFAVATAHFKIPKDYTLFFFKCEISITILLKLHFWTETIFFLNYESIARGLSEPDPSYSSANSQPVFTHTQPRRYTQGSRGICMAAATAQAYQAQPLLTQFRTRHFFLLNKI
jgi:hypothetical protein